MSRLFVVAVFGGLLVVASAQEPADPVAGLIAQLDAEDAKVRARAAKCLGKRGGDRAIHALSRALDDGSAPVRHEAAIALARLAPEDAKAVGVLVESLGSEDWYARWQACLALRLLGPRAKEAVPALIRVSCAEKLDNCREATLALGAIAPKSPEVVDAMLKVLDAQHAVDRNAVIFVLEQAGAGAGRAVPWLAREVHSNEHGCGETAQGLLERLAGDDAEYFVMLFDPEEDERIRAAGYFSGAPKRVCESMKIAATPAFVAALKDESGTVRSLVLEVLGKIGTPANAKAAIPDIVRCSVAEEKSEREAAGRALKAVAPSLARVIEVHPVQEGKWTARLFFWIEPPGEKGGHAILALLTDPAVGDATLAALAQITGRKKEELLAEVRAEAAKAQEVEPKREK